jgi:hypothetical protein
MLKNLGAILRLVSKMEMCYNKSNAINKIQTIANLDINIEILR